MQLIRRLLLAVVLCAPQAWAAPLGVTLTGDAELCGNRPFEIWVTQGPVLLSKAQLKIGMTRTFDVAAGSYRIRAFDFACFASTEAQVAPGGGAATLRLEANTVGKSPALR